MKTGTFRIALVTGLLAMPVTVPVFAQDKTAPTADNQKNNKSDVETTAKIRKSIMDDKTLSSAAHNVKIVTQNGQVTVRGKVKTDADKEAVLAKAKEVAGTNVTDEVTVAPPKK
jgi:hyperosmotically inducible periplasmic protein